MDHFYNSSDFEGVNGLSFFLMLIVILFQAAIEFAVLDPCIRLVHYFDPNENRESSAPPARAAIAECIQGFPNLGLTCFLNAMLQALRYTKSMQVFFQTTFIPESTLASYTKNLLQFQAHDNDQTRSLLTGILTSLPQFNDGNQHCAHSLLLSYLSVLDKELYQTAEEVAPVVPRLLKYRINKCSALHEMCSVLLENRFTCTRCWNGFNNYSYTRSLDVPIAKVCAELDANVKFGEDEYYDYQLAEAGAGEDTVDDDRYHQMMKTFETEGKQKYPSFTKKIKSNTLELSLKYLLRATKMTSDNCFPCAHCLGSETQHIKQSFFRHIGSVLVIHFQRYDEVTRNKEDSLVSYPLVLDLSSLWKDGGKYDLYAVVMHSGSLSSGHYTANARTTGGWRRFNDEFVSEIRESEIVQQNAYILFYERQNSNHSE